MHTLALIATSEKRGSHLTEFEELKTIDHTSWAKALGDLRIAGLKAMTWRKFELSNRAVNALKKNDILNVWDAIRMSRGKIEKAVGLGVKVRAEVYTHVKRMAGITLDNWNDA